MGGMLRHIRAALFACNAWFTDRIRRIFGFNENSLHQLSVYQFLDITMIEMGKATMPECQIKWAGANHAREFSHGHYLTCKMCCIVSIDSCLEEECSIPYKTHAVAFDCNRV